MLLQTVRALKLARIEGTNRADNAWPMAAWMELTVRAVHFS